MESSESVMCVKHCYSMIFDSFIFLSNHGCVSALGTARRGKMKIFLRHLFFGGKSKVFAACGVHFDILSETGLR